MVAPYTFLQVENHLLVSVARRVCSPSLHILILSPAEGMPPVLSANPCMQKFPFVTSELLIPPIWKSSLPCPPSAGSWLLLPAGKGLTAQWGEQTLL